MKAAALPWQQVPFLRAFSSPVMSRVLAPGLAGVLALTYVWRFVLPLLFDPQPRADDLQDYLFASRQLWTGGDPYADFERTHVPWDWSLNSGYIYPPLFAALLLPLTWIPSSLAVRLWLVLLQLMVIASLLLVYRAVGRPGRNEFLVLVAVAATFFPLASNLYTGAMNPLILLLLTAAWAAWRRRADGAAGALLGVGAVIKLVPLGLIPYLALRRHWRLLLVFAASGLGGILLGLALTPLSHNIHFFRDILPHLAGGTGYRENQSIAGLAIRICDPSTADHGGAAGWCGRLVAWPAIAAVLGFLVVAVRRGSRGDPEFALAVTALPLVSSVTWSFHLVILLLPIALLLRCLFTNQEVTAALVTALVAAWCCFSLAPALHFALILNPLPSGPGWWDLVPKAATRLLAEAELLGTVLLFVVLWRMVTREKATV